METQIIAITGQSLLDMALQAGGTIECVFTLALNNDLEITQGLNPGQSLSKTGINSSQISNYYTDIGLKPTTGDNVKIEGEGIGYMIIEETFIVS
jgi:hypothetical protein